MPFEPLKPPTIRPPSIRPPSIDRNGNFDPGGLDEGGLDANSQADLDKFKARRAQAHAPAPSAPATPAEEVSTASRLEDLGTEGQLRKLRRTTTPDYSVAGNLRRMFRRTTVPKV